MNDKTTLTPIPATQTGIKTVEPVSLDKPKEIGGQKGPEPTRFGYWENKGHCTDF
jgi:hypothetical protein